MVKAGKKVKGASKVRENETEDERRIRLEMEALAADEAERRAQEASRVTLRERQLREQKYAHLNGIKIHNQWRKIMRMAKVEELRKEIEILSQNHEREVDRKDAIMQMLDRDLEEAEEQYALAVRSHMTIVDQLLDLQYSRMKALEAEWNADLKALEDEFETERAEIINAHSRQKKDMADMLVAMEHEFADAENELRQEYEAQREEVKNRNQEEYNVLKIQLEGIIEELERHFEQAHKAYLESTEHRTNAFRQLTRNDAVAARVIERRMRKLVKLQESLSHWRTKIATNASEWGERNRALRNEKEIMARHYAQLKQAMDAFRAGQADRLRQLSLSSAAAMQVLQSKLGVAESVIKLAELSRRYETEQEKVLPFFSPSEAVPLPGQADDDEDAQAHQQAMQALQAVSEEEQREAQEAYEDKAGLPASSGSGSSGQADSQHQGEQGVGVGPSGSGVSVASSSHPHGTAAAASKPKLSAWGAGEGGGEVEEYDYLNRFFKRFNKALLDKSAIDKEKARLERENADLRSILKQYLDGISVNDDVLNNPVNPLLVVNNRLQVTLTERNKARAAAMSRMGQSAGPPQQQQLLEVQAVSRMG